MKNLNLYLIFVVALSSCNYVEGVISNSSGSKTDKNLVKAYYDNGVLKSEVRLDSAGNRHGLSKSYFPSGTLKTEIIYNAGTKEKAIQYYENGNPYMEFYYKNGLKDSIRTKFWDNGTIQSMLPYFQDSPGIGLKEFNKKGEELTKYPELIVRQIDNLDKTGEYIIEIYFEGRKNGTYYEGPLLENKYLSNYAPELSKKNGKGQIVLKPYPGAFLMKKVSFIGKLKTVYGNPYIVEKSINLAIDFH